MKLSDFYYGLPESRIAQQPITPRDHSKLLVVSSEDGSRHDEHFYDIEKWLRPTDVLVTNATRVFPARLRGQKRTGGKIELLLLKRLTESEGERTSTQGQLWKVLVRGSTKAADLSFPNGLKATMVERLTEGEWVVRFTPSDIRRYLETHGEMPLPPYIKRPHGLSDDRERYQTVFARSEGAVAAPTAGFHFTAELLERLHQKGVTSHEIILHVGWGTFRPVRTETIEEHHMLAESYEITPETAAAINQAKKEGRRIVGVGTTVVRTLETSSSDDGTVQPGYGESRLFIYPGYRFKVIDALITNFHLPDSTPLLLANAFYMDRLNKILPLEKGGREGFAGKHDPFVLRDAYNDAIEKGYRFYSYGDAMFIQ